MSLPTPITRSEQYLSSIAGEAPALPVPITREERYLAKIAGEDVDIPAKPITRTEQYLAQIVQNGRGAEVESLSVSINGEYTAPSGKAYSPVTVNVPNSYEAGDEGKVVSSGALVAQTSDSVTENGTVDTTLISSLDVNVPQGGIEVPEKDVNFIDYDGTILYSYTAQEFAALTELPANPEHEGLTAQGWNWELQAAKTHVEEMGKLWIGQQYITDDEKTKIFIDLLEGMTSPKVGLYGYGTVSVDWGDGTPETTLVCSGSTAFTDYHKYEHAGKYVISLTVVSGSSLSFNGTSNKSNLLSGANSNETGVYADCIYEIRLGKVITVNQFGISQMHNLKYITIPKTTSVYSAFAYENYALKSITFSAAQTTANCERCYGLRRISLPQGLTTFKFSTLIDLSFSIPNTVTTFSAQYNYVGNIKLPQSVTTLDSYAFSSSPRYTKIIIPSAVNRINTSAFSGSYGIRELIFKPTTPPTLGSTGAFSSLVTSCTLFVPFASLAAYLAASNYPAPATYTYIGFATYNSGVTLPTQDGTGAYNVVWYASKDDAIAQTNPITQGNGKEVYCRYTAV